MEVGLERGSPISQMLCWSRTLAVVSVVLLVARQGLSAELIVGGAVSLREPLLEVGKRFESAYPGVSLSLSFGASSVLAQQIRWGAPIDVFVSADEGLVDRLVDRGLVANSGVAFARNRLVVVTAAKAPFTIARAQDLGQTSVRRIAIPEHSVPVGRYAREWLGRHGMV